MYQSIGNKPVKFMNEDYSKLPPIQRLRAIMARLREEDGCNWDRSQTHRSLIPYLVEETYEVIESIEAADNEQLKEELGDLLLQVIFHSQIAEEAGHFNIEDIAHGINEKLIKRHPHIFSEKKNLNPKEVRSQWEQIKVDSKEKNSVLEGVPLSMPALLQAYRVGEKAAGVGFDWKVPEDVFDKIREELEEFEQEFDAGDKSRMSYEMGDLIFALVNLSRKVGVDPERALRQTVQRFIKRFSYIEQDLKKRGISFSETNLEEMERIWKRSKK